MSHFSLGVWGHKFCSNVLLTGCGVRQSTSPSFCFSICKKRRFGLNYYQGHFESSMILESYETQPVTMVRKVDW